VFFYDKGPFAGDVITGRLSLFEAMLVLFNEEGQHDVFRAYRAGAREGHPG
jgi:hypothetical protein